MRHAWQMFAALLFTTTSLFAVFEPNRGQAASDVRFLARANGAVIFARDGGWSVDLRATGNGERRSRARATIHFRFAGANNATPEATHPLASHSNYFIGNDASRWLRDVPHYESIRYKDVYPGIDAVIHPFEYDFVIAPGADPNRIGVIVDGNPMLRDGAIISGDLVQKKPVAYQERDGVRHDVDVHYALDGNRIRFVLGAYDRALPLIIDPVLTYSTYFGGAGIDVPNAVAIDGAGNAWVGGRTSSSNLPLMFPLQATNKTAPQSTDAFISKFAPDGHLLFSTYLGSVGYDNLYAIAIDGAGNAYIGGETHGLDWPVTAGAFQTSGNPRTGSDGWLTKLGPEGNRMIFSTYLEALNTNVSSTERVRSIALASNGDIYFGLTTEHASFPVTPGAYITTGCGNSLSPVVGRLDPTGSRLIAATYLCGTRSDELRAIALDSANNVYVTGQFDSGLFPYPAANGAVPTGGSFADAYVAKLNPDLNQLLGVKGLGGDGIEFSSSIVIDDADNIWIAGKTGSPAFPLVNATQTKFGGKRNCITITEAQLITCGDGFLTRLDSSLHVQFSTFLGGVDDDEIAGLALGEAGRIYAVGTTNSADFPILSSPFPTPGAPSSFYGHAFVASFLPNGKLEWSGKIGGVTAAKTEGLAIAAAPGVVWAVGDTLSTSFPLVSPIKTTIGSLDTDAFILRIEVPPSIAKKRTTRR